MNSRKANELRFKMEGHIFFDDAWEDEQLQGGGQKRVPNLFFKTFFQLVNQMTGLVSFFIGNNIWKNNDVIRTKKDFPKFLITVIVACSFSLDLKLYGY